MNIIAIIPARSGSSRLVKKNLKKIQGKSLTRLAINTAKKIKLVKYIILTTDDAAIKAEFVRDKDIDIIKRPKRLANNNSNMIDVILHALKKYKKKVNKLDCFILLQPTSPFRSIKKIKFGFNKFIKNKKRCSIVSISRGITKNKRKFIIRNNYLQNIKNKFKKYLNNIYHFNGNFYIATPDFIERNKSFYVKRHTLPIILNSKKLSLDIDDINDFRKAKKYFNSNF